MNRVRLLTVLVVALSALPLVTLAGTAHADLLYQFDVHEVGGFGGATVGIQPFSFSFTVPTFVTAGQSPAFTPFTVDLTSTTLGNHSYKMIDDVAGAVGCFGFDTGGTNTALPDCSFSAPDSNLDGDGAFRLGTPGGLPTATGLQTLTAFSAGVFSAGASAPADAFFGGTLDITSVTSVPEPASVALLSLGVVAVGWRLRKRRGVAL
jgi:PEP-CTERM motif